MCYRTCPATWAPCADLMIHSVHRVRYVRPAHYTPPPILRHPGRPGCSIGFGSHPAGSPHGRSKDAYVHPKEESTCIFTAGATRLGLGEVTAALLRWLRAERKAAAFTHTQAPFGVIVLMRAAPCEAAAGQLSRNAHSRRNTSLGEG